MADDPYSLLPFANTRALENFPRQARMIGFYGRGQFLPEEGYP
jgi:hypothetical protein